VRGGGFIAALQRVDGSGRMRPRAPGQKGGAGYAGTLVKLKSKAARETSFAVDSEHSAIFQCLEAANGNRVGGHP
jgi:hypothetical protein